MTAMFLFIPIPAGVLIYMVISNVMQTIQSYLVQQFLIKADKDKENKVVLESGNTINIGSVETTAVETSTPEITEKRKKNIKK